eukprot:m.270424 g.270424  ORF g.270424 m.270424 type:complete len:157 (-) comp22830_c3_seq5:242-712(-)
MQAATSVSEAMRRLLANDASLKEVAIRGDNSLDGEDAKRLADAVRSATSVHLEKLILACDAHGRSNLEAVAVQAIADIVEHCAHLQTIECVLSKFPCIYQQFPGVRGASAVGLKAFTATRLSSCQSSAGGAGSAVYTPSSFFSCDRKCPSRNSLSS